MKKSFLFALIVFLFNLCVLGQSNAVTTQSNNKKLLLGTVITDTLFENRNLSTELGIEHIFKSKNTIEIRLYSNLSTSKPECIILWYSDHWKAWNIGKYIFDKGNSKLLLVDLKPKKSILDTAFKHLVSNNIFSLPSQNKINQTKFYIDIETKDISLLDVSLTDGICYYVEFKVLTDFRQYKYCNPNAYYEALPSVSELKNFININKILNSIAKR